VVVGNTGLVVTTRPAKIPFYSKVCGDFLLNKIPLLITHTENPMGWAYSISTLRDSYHSKRQDNLRDGNVWCIGPSLFVKRPASRVSTTAILSISLMVLGSSDCNRTFFFFFSKHMHDSQLEFIFCHYEPQ
jgi:hypothetical protein